MGHQGRRWRFAVEGKIRAQSFILVGSVPHRFQIEEDAALYEEEEIPKKRREHTSHVGGAKWVFGFALVEASLLQ